MSHHLRRFSTALLAAPLLAGAVLPVVSARAATAPGHLVSRAQAAAALPAGSAMPGKPGKNGQSTDPSLRNVVVCVALNPTPVKLNAGYAITKYFSGGKVPAEYEVTAVVFHTIAAAKVGLAAVKHAESRCPVHQVSPGGTVTRTLSQPYAANGWTGWRSVDHLSFPADKSAGEPAWSVRQSTEFLVRGNVLLELDVVGDLGPGSGPTQDAARRTATTAMLAGYAKL